MVGFKLLVWIGGQFPDLQKRIFPCMDLNTEIETYITCYKQTNYKDTHI